MKLMPDYDVTHEEQMLIDKIPEVVETGDLTKILDTLKNLYLDEEYRDCLSAMMIIEKYLYRAFELLYFVKNTDVPFAYDEFFFDEKIHNAVLAKAKAKLDANQGLEDYQKGVELVRESKNDLSHEFFKRSALAGNIDGAYNYAICLSRGEGCEVNELEAAFWYWVAACGGKVMAMFNLAQCFKSGIGVCADEMTTLYWYVMAGLKEDIYAVKSVASDLINGIGLPNMQGCGQRLMYSIINMTKADDEKTTEREFAFITATLSTLKDSLEPYIYNRYFET